MQLWSYLCSFVSTICWTQDCCQFSLIPFRSAGWQLPACRAVESACLFKLVVRGCSRSRIVLVTLFSTAAAFGHSVSDRRRFRQDVFDRTFRPYVSGRMFSTACFRPFFFDRSISDKCIFSRRQAPAKVCRPGIWPGTWQGAWPGTWPGTLPRYHTSYLGRWLVRYLASYPARPLARQLARHLAKAPPDPGQAAGEVLGQEPGQVPCQVPGVVPCKVAGQSPCHTLPGTCSGGKQSGGNRRAENDGRNTEWRKSAGGKRRAENTGRKTTEAENSESKLTGGNRWVGTKNEAEHDGYHVSSN